MDERQLAISFEGALPADAALLAQDLEQQLKEAAPAARISVAKSQPHSQDFGATLILLFGTPVAIALAQAVAAFLRRNSGATITISKDGTVVARNLDSKDAAKIAEAFAGRPS